MNLPAWRRRLLGAPLFVVTAAAECSIGLGPPPEVITGTWGGDNAGLIATDSVTHVHIGCTLGDVEGLIRPDSTGRFEVSGKYNVDAYPVDRGIVHPARFIGIVRGNRMTLRVELADTARQLGPVRLTYGREPRMQVCPICRTPKAYRTRGTHP